MLFSLLFSSQISNLLFIPFAVFHFRHCLFHPEISITYISPKRAHVSLQILNIWNILNIFHIWNIFIVTILTPFCLNPSSVLFLNLLLIDFPPHTGLCFLFLCTSEIFWLDTKYSEFCILACWVVYVLFNTPKLCSGMQWSALEMVYPFCSLVLRATNRLQSQQLISARDNFDPMRREHLVMYGNTFSYHNCRSGSTPGI